ncbi:MAG TPA: SDR family oxidoreductase [Frankiaceae bacterium]|jgi:NAD(P)-dependent dehydrogenase (short-subunit alcohol dehydrogenase family)|nr:SDR family oxidoreductase [Frankiaceae bacterium]
MAGMQGKVVAVTGAARGLGASLARQLTERGARVALLGLEPGELDAVSASCPGSRWWEVDVTNSAALNDVAQELAEHFGRLDALVVNAGVACGGPFLHSDAAAFDRTIEINLLGSVRTLRAFLPALVASKGYALQIASLAALAPAPGMAAYCASKSGVEAFAECVRTEVAWHGVDIGIAYLSWTDTDMVRGADEHPDMRDARQNLPGVLGKTYPVEPTVHALCDGIERRCAHVYGQRWVRNVRPIRGLITGLLHFGAKRRVKGAEDLYIAEGPAAGALVGAGGRADTDRRTSKVA